MQTCLEQARVFLTLPEKELGPLKPGMELIAQRHLQDGCHPV
jgi:hypothetical protein